MGNFDQNFVIFVLNLRRVQISALIGNAYCNLLRSCLSEQEPTHNLIKANYIHINAGLLKILSPTASSIKKVWDSEYADIL